MPLLACHCLDVSAEIALAFPAAAKLRRYEHVHFIFDRNQCSAAITALMALLGSDRWLSARARLTMSGQTDHTGKPGHCVFCPDRVAIYTCPRCATRTCSLPCSAAHKPRTGCSGIREKAKFVPMNRYTYGTMMGDYVFLEDMSRKVSEWGQDIVRGGYGSLQGRRGRAEMGPGKTRNGISRKKRDILKLQLELRDVEMDLLPSGMERRVLNQSTWDSKYVDHQLS